MRLSQAERRWRDDLLAALIPQPTAELPAMASLDLAAFWERFHRAAPLHLALGFRAAVLGVAGVLPPLLGYRRAFSRLAADEREAVLQRARRLPLFGDLLEVAKLVACLAYFADPGVEDAIRRWR